jgi:hypothetical protein
MKVYHVAGQEYREGDPLLCRDRLMEAGIETEWKWEAEEGHDHDVVCVFDTIEEARAFVRDFAPQGRILTITVAPEDVDDPIAWDTRFGTIHPQPTETSEGYLAMRDGIPAEWID